MGSMRLSRVIAFGALLLAGAGQVSAAGFGGGVAVGLVYGVDSNPLKLSGGEREGNFSEVRLAGGLDLGLNRQLSLFLNGDGAYRRYASGVSNADFGRAEGRLGLTIRPRSTSVSIALGGLYGLNRSTFTDRITGGAYEVVTDSTTFPETTVTIPDRFSADTTGAFMDIRWRPVRPVRLFLRTQAENTDFIEDYADTGVLDSLDFAALTLEPGVQYQVNRMMVVSFSLMMTDLSYDDQPALDIDGSEVPGSQRRYRYAEYRFTVLVSPTRKTYLNIGFRGGDRDDSYAGYYDFGARVVFVSLDQTVGRKNDFSVYGSLQNIDYDRAVVPGTIDAVVRESETQRLIGRYGRRLHRNVSLFVEGGAQRTDNSDPTFAYDRDWVLTGFEFRR